MGKQMHPKDQKSVDHIAEKRGPVRMKAVGNNAPGGEYGDMGRIDETNLNDPTPKFKGIKIHDKGPDSWGLRKAPRYEE